MSLSTRYLGLTLRSPIVASASPLSADVHGVQSLADAGVGAVVLYSLFEEQLTLRPHQLSKFLASDSSYAEALSEISESHRLGETPLDYLRHVSACRRAVDIPIIASINGAPRPGWGQYAKLLEQAGASALEINLYWVCTDPEITGADVENRYIETIARIVREVGIPVSVKLSPYFSNVGNLASRLEEVGVEGLVLFNRFYQPDIDVARRQVRPRLELSTSHALRLPLRWTAILRGHVDCNLAITSGVHHAEDIIKAILVGADVAMVCAVLLKQGVEHVATLERGLRAWMVSEDILSLDDVRGVMSHERHDDPAAFERAQYIRTLESAS